MGIGLEIFGRGLGFIVGLEDRGHVGRGLGDPSVGNSDDGVRDGKVVDSLELSLEGIEVVGGMIG